jgi:hypothetical protein
MRVELTGQSGQSDRAQLVVEWTTRESTPKLVAMVEDAHRLKVSVECDLMPGVLWRVREVKAIVAQLRLWAVK